MAVSVNSVGLKVTSKLSGLQGKVLCMSSVEHSSAFPERVRMCSVVNSLMNCDIADPVLVIQYL